MHTVAEQFLTGQGASSATLFWQESAGESEADGEVSGGNQGLEGEGEGGWSREFAKGKGAVGKGFKGAGGSNT